MNLKVIKRTPGSKKETNSLRRNGHIPAVIYVRGKEGEALAVSSAEFGAFLRGLKSGHLPTSIFTLVDDKGHERRVVVKDIQYNITTYDVTHLDFEELVDDHKINVKIPIECTGVVDSVGIKQGGVLRQVIRHVRVRCFPKDLPSFFELDVSELSLKQSKRLSDLVIPEGVQALKGLKEVVAVIVKR